MFFWLFLLCVNGFSNEDFDWIFGVDAEFKKVPSTGRNIDSFNTSLDYMKDILGGRFGNAAAACVMLHPQSIVCDHVLDGRSVNGLIFGLDNKRRIIRGSADTCSTLGECFRKGCESKDTRTSTFGIVGEIGW